VRHLLHQTSGISTAAGNADFTRDDAADDALERRVRALQAIPLLSLIWSALALRRWRANPSLRPQGLRLAWRIVGVCGTNLLVALLFLVIQPRLFGIGLRGTLLLSPDIGAMMLASSVIALSWCIVYPLLLWKLSRGAPAPGLVSAPAHG
jgi:hypothetical protein